MQAIILVGGLGTRLKSVVSDRPKPMAKIVNKPFVEYVLDELKSADITNVIFAVGYKGEMMEEYFGTGDKWGIDIKYAYERDLMGTAGAIRNSREYIKERHILVLNGDTYYNLDYKNLIDFGIQDGLDIAIMLRRVQDISRYGKVSLEGNRIVGFNEKEALPGPGIINGGIYFLKSSLIDEIPKGKVSLENDMIPLWLDEKKKLGGIINDRYFIDIGIPEDYYKFVDDINMRNNLHMEKMMGQIDNLIENKVTSSSSLLLCWRQEMKQCLQETFGLSSKEYNLFNNLRFEPEKLSIQDDYRKRMEEYCKEQLIWIKCLWGEGIDN